MERQRLRSVAARPRVLVSVLALVLVLVAAGCGSSSKSSSSGATGSGTTTSHVHFAKTKFVFHAGLAFGAFHRYIYKPLKAGDFSHPLAHKAALVKGAIAAAFVYHEVKLALHDAQSSRLLSKVVAPLTGLAAVFAGLKARIKSGHIDSAQLQQANSQIGSIKQHASTVGAPVTEHAPAL